MNDGNGDRGSPHTPAHPGNGVASMMKPATPTTIEPVMAGEIADIVIRFGSARWVTMPFLVLGVCAAVVGLVTYAPGADSEKALRQLLGLVLGPLTVAVVLAFASALIVGWFWKVRAELALRALDVEPSLRKRAYQVALAARRSPRAWFIPRTQRKARIVRALLEITHEIGHK
ncbi:MAG: hypothetical protein ACO3JL_11240 [Myxococcota bacterium]